VAADDDDEKEEVEDGGEIAGVVGRMGRYDSSKTMSDQGC
jgi:hypothetical protein